MKTHFTAIINSPTIPPPAIINIYIASSFRLTVEILDFNGDLVRTRDARAELFFKDGFSVMDETPGTDVATFIIPPNIFSGMGDNPFFLQVEDRSNGILFFPLTGILIVSELPFA